jgi:MoxR-like ATPase
MFAHCSPSSDLGTLISGSRGERVNSEVKVESSVLKAQGLVQKIIDNIERVIIGKRHAIELALIALLSQGHLLIEDAPGVGKTMFARSLAKSINCKFKRIQFTPDLFPGDITGISVYNQKTDDFEFRPGPIIAQIVLADEINRATPKVQSALLECMGEQQITVDGATYKMPHPFHIIATQNPIEYEGTFPLPETQLDRFLLRLSLGFPSAGNEIVIMERQQFVHPIEQLSPVTEADDLVQLQETVKTIYIDDLIKQYIVSVVEATRHHPGVNLGASPRGSLALFRTAQARALIQGRDYALPDDVKALAEPVLAHRLIVHLGVDAENRSGRTVIADVLEAVPVPGALPTRRPKVAR